MTKKHYEAIAECIHSEVRGFDERAISSMVFNIIDKLAVYFQEENPKFDRERFLSACGVENNSLFESPEQTIRRIKNETS